MSLATGKTFYYSKRPVYVQAGIKSVEKIVPPLITQAVANKKLFRSFPTCITSTMVMIFRLVLPTKY